MGSTIKIDNKKIIFFDGFCNLCNNKVKFLLKHDREGKFHLSVLSSNFAKKILKEKLPFNSRGKFLVYLSNDNVYIRSKAVLKILSDIGGIYKIFNVFTVFPSFFLDFFYNIISKNRYNWFGKSNSCFIPTKEITNRFIND